MERKVYTEANKEQIHQRDLCLEGAKKHQDLTLFDVYIDLERVFDWNGTLQFFINIKAKPNTGMLFLSDKTFLVHIGRRGKVRSMNPTKDKKLKDNKHHLFII